MPYAIDRFVRYAVNGWQLPSEGSNEQLAKAEINALSEFIVNAGLPTTMRQLGVKDEVELKKIAATVQTGPGTYHKCSTEDVENIFKSCW